MIPKTVFLFAAGLIVASVFPPPGSRAFGDEPADASAAVIALRHSAIEYDQSTTLVASTPNILQDRLVQLGDKVKAGQVLGRLFDQIARADHDLIVAASESDMKLQASKTDLALALNKLSRTENLSRRNYVSAEDLKAEQYAVERARLAVKEAEEGQNLAQIQRRRAAAQLRSLEFVSPHDGVVVGAFRNQGESVNIGEPVFKVVNTDRLKVWGSLNVSDAWKVQVGQSVRVRLEIAGVDLPIEREVFSGRLVFIDSQVDPVTQTCKVLALVNNHESRLRSGLQATLEILPRQEGAQAEAGRKEKEKEKEKAGEPGVPERDAAIGTRSRPESTEVTKGR